jgi:hypothetical protein
LPGWYIDGLHAVWSFGLEHSSKDWLDYDYYYLEGN